MAYMGVTVLGFRELHPPEAGELFKKFEEKSMKNVQFLKQLQGNFAIFSKFFLIFYRIFGEKLGQKFRHAFVGGSAAAPHILANLWKSEQKNQLKPALLDRSHRKFVIFSIFKEVYRIFRENCASTLGKYGCMYLQGFAQRSPKQLENLKRLYSKIQWKASIF